MSPQIIAAFLLTASLFVPASCNSSGAPVNSNADLCASMKPNHYGTSDSSDPLPFRILVPKTNYTAGETQTLTLESTQNGVLLKGFLIQAIEAGSAPGDAGAKAYGTFSKTAGEKVKLVDCFGGSKNAATHSEKIDSGAINLTWTAPSDAMGKDLEFRVTFLKTMSAYWVAKPSDKLMFTNETNPVASTTQETPISTQPMTTTTSGAVKNPISLVVFAIVGLVVFFGICR